MIDSRGLQYSKLDGIQTETDRYLKKNNFLLVAKFSKMFHFLSIHIQNLKMLMLKKRYIFRHFVKIKT
jgi:hypothetical protein